MTTFYDELLKATDNLGDITFSRFGTITSIDNDFCTVKEEEQDIIHQNVPILNKVTAKVGDKVVLGFVDNSLYNPIVLGNLTRGTSGVVVDTEMSSISTNAVQNKVIQSALNGKANSSHTHTKSQITDFPTIPSKTSDLTNDGDGSNVFVKDNDSRLSDSRTPTSHTHGQITNAGALTSSAVTVASGDYILITDVSNSNYIRRVANLLASHIKDGTAHSNIESSANATQEEINVAIDSKIGELKDLIGDAIINISASRPYLLSGEKTDLVVTLHNGVGTPLANKSVTISDGTSVYTGITNNQGIFTVYDISVSSNTTFTATYGTISDSCLVEYCLFVDYGVTGNHNDTWYRHSGTDNRTVTVNGTTLANTTSTRYDIFAYYGTASDIYLFQPPLTVELDIVDIVGSGARFQMYDKVTLATYNEGFSVGHWKIVYDGTTIKPYYNGVEQTNYTRDMPNARVGFIIPQNCSITYKNFRIREG